ncbi:MAG: nickel-dependent hydrogenase large subunit [Desulfovibrionaceae bacterium]|nr:nickel-dependent hydrogenase large subunit [Desulfovibrionaceae bacterium]
MPDKAASTLRIVPDRLCGEIVLEIRRDPEGAHQAWLRMPDLRGFERLVLGRPGEELPRLASRIYGICPWTHHITAVMAVENALNIVPPPAALLLRELILLLSNMSDTLLHFHLLSGPDILPEKPLRPGNTFVLLENDALARQALALRARLQRMLGCLFSYSLCAHSVVVGGLSRPASPEAVAEARAIMEEMRDFCLKTMESAREELLPSLYRRLRRLDALSLPWLALFAPDGGLPLWGGALRLLLPDGAHTDHAPETFQDLVVEEHAAWTRCAFPRLREHTLSLDPDAPQGVYRVGALARINTCASLDTPLAQKELELFRADFGRAPQQTCLYHQARLIELVRHCERAELVLRNPQLTDPDVRVPFIQPCSGEGRAYVEAPRGGLFYRVRLDDEACILACDIISPTTQNNAAMNISLTQAARAALREGQPEAEALDRIVQCLRAYDPCPACATH